MPRRHNLHEGHWPSVFERLLELITAGSGEDPFEEVCKLAAARLFAEQSGRAFPDQGPVREPLLALLREASGRWPRLVPDPTPRLPAPLLASCARVLAPLSLVGAQFEALDAAFEVLVSHAAKGHKGQFFTPRHVIEACVRAVAPAPGERVLDPACGSGGFLLHASRHCPDVELRGYDIDARACRVAAFLLQAAGARAELIVRQDSLAAPSGPPEADVLLANPPFAGEVTDPALLARYEVASLVTRVERDALFLERSVRAVRPGGRMAIVLPHNKLGGVAWAPLRGWLLRQTQVVSVLSLGRHTFLPHTHQKTCVLFALRRPAPVDPPAGEPLLLALSEREGKDSRGRPLPRPGAQAWAQAWERLDHDLDSFVENFHTFVRRHRLPWGCLKPDALSGAGRPPSIKS